MSLQGYPPDKFDDEWDAHIVHTYGLIAAASATNEQNEPKHDDNGLTDCGTSSF